MWDYTDKVRDHYLHPRNVGEVENPDGVGEIGNITCGDALRLTFKLDDSGRVKDIKFKTFGCGSAIASASALTEMCMGKTLDEIRQITNKHIADELGGLPKEKMHCSVMGQEALEAAITYYETGGKVAIPPEKEGTVVCVCFGVTDKEIIKAVTDNNCKTVDDITNYTKAGGACGNCKDSIQRIINETLGQSNAAEQPKKKLTLLQKIDRVREVLKNDVNPVLAKDGGSCELLDIENDTVTVRLQGHCSGCAFSSMTLVSVVERKIKELVSDELVIKLG
ncbi:MAG TPA: Fe-S cluster assembly protein NifU [Chitinispirillaceae bacterium]|nr:Fe-S cluster assembly protein NifU [Chitinispirillaceae bacterium]